MMTPYLSAMSASQTPRSIGLLVGMFFWCLVLTPIMMLFLPWQQNVNGSGRVSAFAPIERQQTIDAPIVGRIAHWHVQEGSRVQKGDLLVELTDIDPQFRERLQQQREVNLSKLSAKEQELHAYEQQIDRLETVRDMKTAAAQSKLDMATQKLTAAEESAASALATQETALLQKKRLAGLLQEGLVSRRDFEMAERDEIVARRALNSAQAVLRAAQAEQRAAQAERRQVEADAQAKINSTLALLNKVRGEIADIRNSLLSVDVSLARQSAQQVIAPQDGIVLRLLQNPHNQIVKQGDPLLILVPVTDARAVEVWVSGNDAPLILPGHHARLMFEGWPAVQFVGWPEIAVGTFGGRVAFVDASDNGHGQFRVLIVPDESDHPWPSPRFLRQGGAVKAWILLEQVSLGYEIWRQLNGFPPMLTPEHPYRDLERGASKASAGKTADQSKK